jgi:hypothetical protein
MKKSYLMIAAAVAMFTACEDNDTFRKDIQNNSSENGEAIGFTSFTEKVTKAENSESLYTWTFFDHQESFQVWARKSNQPNKEIFDGTTVSVEKVDPTTYNYTYSPDRYWDKLAENYNYYAAAPDPATITGAAWEWDFKDDGITTTDPTSINKGYFKINDNKFALNGVNLQSKENAVSGKYATANLRNVFKTAKVTKGTTEYKDVDLLIADDAPVARAFYNKANPEAVNLNFIHILSKLNITISTSLPISGDNAHDVDLLAFEVKNVPNTGSFNENTANLSTNKKWIRWTLDDDTNPTKTDIATGIEAYDATTYEIDGPKAVDVPYTNAVAPAPVSEATTPGKIYIVESLIIPQEINYQRVALDGLDHPAVNEPAVPFSSYQEYTESKPVEDPRITAAELNRLTKTVENKLVFKTWDEYKVLEGATNDEDIFNELVEEASKVKAVNILAYDEPSEPYFTITYSIDGEVFTANYNLAAAFLNKTNDETKTENNLVSPWEGTFGFYEGWQNTLNIIINPSAIQFTADVAEWSSNTEVSYEVKE